MLLKFALNNIFSYKPFRSVSLLSIVHFVVLLDNDCLHCPVVLVKLFMYVKDVAHAHLSYWLTVIMMTLSNVRILIINSVIMIIVLII